MNGPRAVARRRARTQLEQAAPVLIIGGVGLALVLGAGKVFLDMRQHMHDMGREREPWERDSPG